MAASDTAHASKYVPLTLSGLRTMSPWWTMKNASAAAFVKRPARSTSYAWFRMQANTGSAACPKTKAPWFAPIVQSDASAAESVRRTVPPAQLKWKTRLQKSIMICVSSAVPALKSVRAAQFCSASLSRRHRRFQRVRLRRTERVKTRQKVKRGTAKRRSPLCVVAVLPVQFLKNFRMPLFVLNNPP